MTHEECVAALRGLDRRIYLLPLVAQIHEACLSRIVRTPRPVIHRALDVTRRWCLGEATQEECWAAAYAADANYADANYAAVKAAADAAAKAAADAAAAAAAADAADAADAAAADAADAADARQRLVDAVRGVEWADAVCAAGNVRTRTHVWWREGELGGKWWPLTDVESVRFDAVLEAA